MYKKKNGRMLPAGPAGLDGVLAGWCEYICIV